LRIVEAFRKHEAEISTESLLKTLTSNQVLKLLERDLQELGFPVETGKGTEELIERPVFFGENGMPTLRFEVDAYHPEWLCGLEIEAGRGISNGAFYRDLVQAMVMVGVSHLCIAMKNRHEWGKAGKSKDYQIAVNTAQALFGHSRIRLPYGLTIIGY